MVKDLAKVLATPLQRRQVLKLIAGTAGTLTLAACRVAPGETPEPRTNLLVLRAKVKNLEGRDRERLRAIADFLDPANRNWVDILGEYWAEDGLIINGKPGNEFINGGIHIVVLAKGESAAAVRAWADQWADVLDIDSDEAAAIDLDPLNPDDDDQTFLVFERIEGATTPKAVFGAEPGDVDIGSHHALVNDGLRQVVIVRAPSRGAVYEWVNDWGYHQAIQVVRLSNLSEKLRTCARSSRTAADTATLATAPFSAAPFAAAPPQETIEVADYHPDGLLLTTDKKVGSFYFRHRSTGRFLAVAAVDGGFRIVSVATPAPHDKWTFNRGPASTSYQYELFYSLQHQGTGFYLGGDLQGNVSASTDTQALPWQSGLTTWQKYGIGGSAGDDKSSQRWLTIDDNNLVHTSEDGYKDTDWDQWSDYQSPPTELEQILHDLVTTDKYDFQEKRDDGVVVHWPEDLYKGDELVAYNDILTHLEGRVPKNGNVTTGALNDAKAAVQDKNNGSLPAAYYPVFEHLYEENGYFADLKTWYGNGGNVYTLLNDTTIDRLAIINAVQNLAEIPSGSNMNVKFAFDTYISLMAIALAAAVPPPFGGVVGGLINLGWRLYNTATGGANGTLNTTFATLDYDLSNTFDALEKQREDTHNAIASNWGKLKTFSGLISTGTLVWQDTDPVLATAKKQFEISVWKTVANANWRITGTGEYRDSSMGEAIEFAHIYLNSPWDYVTLTEAYFWIWEWGWTFADGVLTDHCYLYKAPSDLVAKRLFDDLGIDMTDFYLSRNGWAIPGNLG